jgi:Lrp/AsnC family leucine-responsive transcriptional regulator
MLSRTGSVGRFRQWDSPDEGVETGKMPTAIASARSNSLWTSMTRAKSTPFLDDADRRILRVLQQDGRIAVTALAEQVGLSATPCLRRIRRLEEAGVIARYTAVLDPRRVGLPIQAFVQVALASHAEGVSEAFQKAIAARGEVLAAWAMSGDMDYMLHVVAEDFDAYAEFALKALLRMPGVKETRSSFVLTALKPAGAVPV